MSRIDSVSWYFVDKCRLFEPGNYAVFKRIQKILIITDGKVVVNSVEKPERFSRIEISKLIIPGQYRRCHVERRTEIHAVADMRDAKPVCGNRMILHRPHINRDDISKPSAPQHIKRQIVADPAVEIDFVVELYRLQTRKSGAGHDIVEELFTGDILAPDFET